MLSIGAEFQIRDDFAMPKERGNAVMGDGIPDVNAFIRTRRGQVSAGRIDVNFNQISRIVAHRSLRSSYSFAILQIVNSKDQPKMSTFTPESIRPDHAILTGRTDEFTCVING